jgi:hypothetical protein
MHNAFHGKNALAFIWLLGFAFQSTLFGAEKPEYLASFDPAKGFKPAQSDLTEVFLQLAGSLEYYGTPEPYLRHMKAEHARIEAKYREKFGTAPKSFCPPDMTDAYFDRLSANWKLLAPKLGLESLTKNTGNLMRDAINGTRGNGTMLVDVFNRHQARVYAAMTGKGNELAGFEALKAELISRLYLDKTSIDDKNFKMAERDAVGFTVGIRDPFIKLFVALDASLKPTDASRIKAFVLSICTEAGRMAQSELEVAIAEHALDRRTAAK